MHPHSQICTHNHMYMHMDADSLTNTRYVQACRDPEHTPRYMHTLSDTRACTIPGVRVSPLMATPMARRVLITRKTGQVGNWEE